MARNAAMTPRANAKLCGMKYVHIAPDNNPSPYLTPKNLATDCAAKRSIAGLKSTPASTTRLDCSRSPAAPELRRGVRKRDAREIHRTRERHRDDRRKFRNFPKQSLGGEVAFALSDSPTQRAAASAAAIVPSQSFTVVASTNSFASHRPAFTVPLRKTRMPVPSNVPRLN